MKTMILTEVTPVASAVLPVQGLKDHLRLGSGFSDDGMQDGLIEAYLRAAMAAIEGRIGKVILARQFKLVLPDWRNPDEQPLPVAPVSGVSLVRLLDANLVGQIVAPSRYRLVQDQHRPKLAASGLLFPAVPADGLVEIFFEAGFGSSWAAIPADLAQAVLLLAAEYYENRQGDHSASGIPQRVQALIERWRTVRVLGGGAA